VERKTDGSEHRPLDLSFTKTAAGLCVNSLIMVLLILCTARWYRRHESTQDAPGGFVGMMESVITTITEEVIEPCIGPNYLKFAPYLLTAFFFILINNLMGLIPIFPGGTNVTGNIAITMVLALASFFVINIFGTKHYWKDVFWPDVPWWLKVPLPIMPFIEFIGLFTKPFALMIRLFANIMAGHSVILILTCIVFVTAKMGPVVNSSMTGVSVLLSIFMNCLELLVAFIQAYVFTMLSAVFIGLAQESPEEEKQEA
jgi:F-type H+-transporting ATPase subunit a